MDIGHKIKQLRVQNGLTLEELASRSELTKGFLSQLERNLTSPSISTLEDILEALGSSLSDFFKEEKDEQTVFQKKDFFVDERDDYTINWIVPNKRYVIKKGETFYMTGKDFHYITNEKTKTAKIIWVSTPPLF